MPVSALSRLHVPGPVTPHALRRFMAVAGRARRQWGFRYWQTFRGIHNTDAVLVVTDWSEADDLRRFSGDVNIARAVADVCGNLDLSISAPEVLESVYDVRFLESPSVSSLLRVCESPCPIGPQTEQREKEFWLQVMAAPGSIRLNVGRNARRTVSTYRIDFQDEDGMWAFLDSPLRKEWTRQSELAGERELWALNLPRLEFGVPATPDFSPSENAVVDRSTADLGALSLELVVDSESHTATIRFKGVLDPASAAHAERIGLSLLNGGTQCLVLDIQDLKFETPQDLAALVRLTKMVKDAGGKYQLIDNGARFKMFTRAMHLKASLAAATAQQLGKRHELP